MNTGQIVKSKTTESFTVIPNDFLQNKTISLQAKGLLGYLLSLPHDWVINKMQLYSIFTENKRTSVDSAFNELVGLGYILSAKIINEDTHQFIGYNYIVYSTPNTSENQQEPIAGFPQSGFLQSENQHLQKKEYTKDILTTKERELGISEKQTIVQAIPDSVDDVKQYMLEQNIMNAEANAIKFFNFYEAKGWMIGKNKVKSWKSCVKTWDLPKNRNLLVSDKPKNPW